MSEFSIPHAIEADAGAAAAARTLTNLVDVWNRFGRSRVVLLCEHASNFIPANDRGLGLSGYELERHIAWDIGALATAKWLSSALNAPLVCATHSRLLLDLNRPLGGKDSIVRQSEDTVIPGNLVLSDAEIRRRQQLYAPFHTAIAELLELRRVANRPAAVISIHSFTPSYQHVARPWHIGVLSQHDRRLADALLAQFRAQPPSSLGEHLRLGDNQPYAPSDGVYHSIEIHGETNGWPCAMLEIRNDLITNATQQRVWGEYLALVLERALHSITQNSIPQLS